MRTARTRNEQAALVGVALLSGLLLGKGCCNAVRMSKAPPDPEFYRCPYCREAMVDWIGNDMDKKPIYRCVACGGMMQEVRLVQEEASRRSLD